MKNRAARLVSFLVVMAGVLAGCADHRLASTRYRAAWAALDMDALADLLEDVDFETIGDEEWDPPEGVTLEALERFGPERFFYAGEAEYAGWEFEGTMDWIAGPFPEYPRNMSRTNDFLTVLARLQIDARESEGAARTVLAGYQASMHACDGYWALTSLVGMRGFERIDSVARYGELCGVLSSKMLAPVGDFLSEPGRSMHYWYTLPAVVHESEYAVECFEYQYARRSADEMVEWFEEQWESSFSEQGREKYLRVMSDSELWAQEIELWEEYCSEWEDIFLPWGDYQEKVDWIAEVNSRFTEERYGVIAAVFGPVFGPVFHRRIEMIARYRAARDRYSVGDTGE